MWTINLYLDTKLLQIIYQLKSVRFTNNSKFHLFLCPGLQRGVHISDLHASLPVASGFTTCSVIPQPMNAHARNFTPLLSASQRDVPNVSLVYDKYKFISRLGSN